jgi:hypothetical protein
VEGTAVLVVLVVVLVVVGTKPEVEQQFVGNTAEDKMLSGETANNPLAFEENLVVVDDNLMEFVSLMVVVEGESQVGEPLGKVSLVVASGES